jgi:hypothetical protein
LSLAVFFLMFALREKTQRARIQYFLRTWARFLAGFVPFLLLFFWYNAVRFGSIFEAGYSLWARDRNIENFSNPIWLGLVGELVSPGKGVFVYCPVLLLAFLGAKQFVRRQRELAVLILLATIFFLVFFATYKAWHGDNAWGARYLTFLMPLWMLFLGEWMERRQPPISRRHVNPAYLLVALSFCIQLAAVLIDKNLHYNRLNLAGIIPDEATYAYPPRLYFQAEYSPLINRFREVPEALRFTWGQVFIRGNTLASEAEELVSIDFWWINRLSRGMNPFGCLLLAAPLFFEVFACTGRLRAILKSSDSALVSTNTGEESRDARAAMSLSHSKGLRDSRAGDEKP